MKTKINIIKVRLIINHRDFKADCVMVEPKAFTYMKRIKGILKNNINIIISPIMDRTVIVEYAPITERYWNKGDKATIRNNKIRLGGCWFDFDARYDVKEIEWVLVLKQDCSKEKFNEKFKKKFGQTYDDWWQQKHITTHGEAEQITWTDGNIRAGHTCYDSNIHVYIKGVKGSEIDPDQTELKLE